MSARHGGWRRPAAVALALLGLLALRVYLRIEQGEPGSVEELHSGGTSGVMVEAAGEVERLLPDDREGSPHQRFVVRLASGHTLLVAHNLELAGRLPLAVGDRVELRGQYEWNERGGVVHWTHHDPEGRRAGGWIRHRGVVYL